MRLDQCLDRAQVVIPRDQRLSGDGLRHTGAPWNRKRRRARSGFDQQRVGMAVIATFELDHEIVAGRRTGDPQRAHRRLGSAVHKPQPFD